MSRLLIVFQWTRDQNLEVLLALDLGRISTGIGNVCHDNNKIIPENICLRVNFQNKVACFRYVLLLKEVSTTNVYR